MSGAKLPGWYTVWIRVVSGLYRGQPVAVPPVPGHLRFTRQRHPPRQVTLPPPYPFPHPPSQRVVEVAALHQWLAVLYPRVEHQTVLAVVVVVVGPLVVRPYNTLRDEVRLLRQPAVFIVAVDIVRILRDAVIRPRREGTVRVQLRVRQPVSRRVRRIRDIDIQVRCPGCARPSACPWRCNRTPASLAGR